MTELFANIPQFSRDAAKFMVDLALSQNNGIAAVQMLDQYARSCPSEEERDFFNFYVNMRLTQLHEDTTDFR